MAGIGLDKVESAIGERGICSDQGGIRKEFVSGVGSVATTGWEMTVDFRLSGCLFYLYTIKFSEDLVPLTDLKVNPGRVVKHTTEAHRPVLLTSRGRGVAVVQSVADYEKAEEERDFMRAVVAGLADLDTGREISFDEAWARLGLK